MRLHQLKNGYWIDLEHILSIGPVYYTHDNGAAFRILFKFTNKPIEFLFTYEHFNIVEKTDKSVIYDDSVYLATKQYQEEFVNFLKIRED